MLTNRHSAFAILTAFIGTFNIMFYKVFMVVEFTLKAREEPIKERDAGPIISIPAFFYVFGSLALPYTCEHSPRKWLFFIAFVGFGIQMFFMGPSRILRFGELDEKTKMWMTIFSLPFNGIFQIFVFIPIIPEMLERLQVDLDIVEGEDEKIDL